MGQLLLELLPFIAGLAVTPAAVATGILFLGSHRPVANALAFAGGFAAVYAVLSGLVLLLTGGDAAPLISPETKAWAGFCVGLLLLALAAAMMVRRRLHIPAKPSRLSQMIGEARPRRAFGVGIVLAIVNPNVPILLGGLTVVAAAPIDGPGRVLGVLALLAGAELGLIGPALWYVARPVPAAQRLKRLNGWLERHHFAVDLTVLLLFGALFTATGLVDLFTPAG
ncbi:GAP family protein [Paractinoplanes maris]|uniref:GAP family protein n=1 Tax=Paractinoplanes maris TaxID=1734446 RepID=UPI002020C810|nr:GAP family protein [Actinoplanes maris]